MTTINEIRDGLVETFNALRNGTMEAKDAVEINNTAGKIISSAKVQIAYHALREEAPEIPFLAAQSATPLGSGRYMGLAEQVISDAAKAA